MGFKKMWQKLWLIMSFAKPHWKLLAVTTFLSFIAINLGLIQPWLMKIFLDDVLINQKFTLFYWLLAAFVGLFIFDQIFRFISDYAGAILSQRLNLTIKTRILNHLLNLHVGFFHKKKVGDLLSRINSDASSIESFIHFILNTVFLQSFRTVTLLIISLTLSWQATFLTLSVFPFYLLSEKFFVKRLKKMEKSLLQKSADIQSYLQESLASVRAIKVFSRERDVTETYAERVKTYNTEAIRRSVISHLSFGIRFFIAFIPSFVVLSVGGYQVMVGALTVGTLIALRSYIAQVFGSIETFFNVNRNVQLVMVPIDRVLEILETEPKIKSHPKPVPFKKVQKHVWFDNVAFAYGATPILTGINLVIPSGQHVGIVGPSGEGKSTLANMLIRFYDPVEGSVRIDGTDIRHFDVEAYRSRIGFVSQDSILFNMTIRDNIKFAKPEATEAEMVRAAKLAEIDEFIMELPEGYDTNVGERGEMLSGGQKQRISIARAILRDPEIYILDEPTSALDPETERKIQASLDMITQGKTSLIIAHRLSTLQNADKIVVLDNKKIVEEGNFSQLMKKKGKFFHYFNSQFRTYQNFISRLMTEVGRAERYNRPLHLATIEFNVDGMEENEIKRLLEKVEIVLEKCLKEPHFFAKPPHFTNSIQIALPELSKNAADKYIRDVTRYLRYTVNQEQITMSMESDIGKIAQITR